MNEELYVETEGTTDDKEITIDPFLSHDQNIL